MGNRTTIIILAIAAVLVAFIYLFERDSMTTSEREERQDRVFGEFRRDQVDGLTVKGTGGVEIVLERTRSEVEDGEERWKIRSPKDLQADPSEVRSLLAAIDFLIAGRTVTGAGSRADAKFGLTSPRLEASFTIEGVATRFGIGADAQGDKVYLGIDGEDDRFYAVEQEFLEAFDKTLDELRSKQLVNVDLADPSRLELRREEGTLELRRSEDGPWQLERDASFILAAEAQVGEIVRALADLKASSFVADEVADGDLDEHGLGEAAPRFTITPAKGEPVTVRVGSPCAEGEHQVKVTVTGSGTVACVKDDFLENIARPAKRLEERRPAVFRDDDVSRIVLTRGAASLKLARIEEEWKIEGEEEMAVEQTAVSELLGSFRDTTAKEIVAGEAAVAALGQPLAEIAFELVDEGDTRKLALYEAEDEETELLRRAGENAVLRLPVGLAARIRPERLAFRRRLIENGQPHEVDHLRIEGQLAAQTLERKDGAWQVIAPVAVPADGTGARKLTELLAALKVKGFVASEARPAHGLAEPFAVISARFAAPESTEEGEDRTGSKTVVLELGAPAEGGGRLARLRGDDSSVFTVGQEYVAAAARPLVARDLLQIDDTILGRLALGRGTSERVFAREGTEWKAADGSPVDAKKLARLITDLGSLKTIRADSFGQGAEALGEPLLVIESTPVGAADAGAPSVITVGSKTCRGEACLAPTDEDGYLARLAGLDITFVIPARIVEDAMGMVGL